MKKLNAEYDQVVIIDCLSEKERKESQDSALLAKFLANEGITNRYYYCGNKLSVLHLLNILIEESSKGISFPIVFISHGTNLSLLVKHTNEYIDWQELRQPLLEINKNMRGNLYVLMACCHGFNGYKIDKRDSDNESFFGIIGPNRTILPEESINANEIFFKSLLDGDEIPIAVEKINKAFKEKIYNAMTTQYNKLK